MVSHPELGSDPPIGSNRESGRDMTSSTSSAGVDNWSHNHHMEIVDPLRASAGGVTPSSTPHNSATSNTHVLVTAGLWIRSPRMIATSYNVIVISPTDT